MLIESNTPLNDLKNFGMEGAGECPGSRAYALKLIVYG